MIQRALVLFSGGQDSTTCLAWALDRYDHVETIGFAYGQRHAVEMTCRAPILARLKQSFPGWAARLGPDHEFDLSLLGQISETALTRDKAIEWQANGLPSSFVPGRNLLFLTYAAALAYRRGIDTLVGGMCETDYSGYPDCRDATMRAMQEALTLGLDTPLSIQTPLMQIDKAATWQLARQLGGDELVRLIVEDTHTCYLGERGMRHPWGAGCGECPACTLRRRGFEAFTAT